MEEEEEKENWRHREEKASRQGITWHKQRQKKKTKSKAMSNNLPARFHFTVLYCLAQIVRISLHAYKYILHR